MIEYHERSHDQGGDYWEVKCGNDSHFYSHPGSAALKLAVYEIASVSHLNLAPKGLYGKIVKQSLKALYGLHTGSFKAINADIIRKLMVYQLNTK